MEKLETEVLEENSSNKTDNEASKSAFSEVLTALVAENWWISIQRHYQRMDSIMHR